MTQRRPPIILAPADRQELEQLATLPPQSPRGRRARILLLLAGGHSTGDICARIGCSPQTVKAWRLRYRSRGLVGLRHSPHSAHGT